MKKFYMVKALLVSVFILSTLTVKADIISSENNIVRMETTHHVAVANSFENSISTLDLPNYIPKNIPVTASNVALDVPPPTIPAPALQTTPQKVPTTLATPVHLTIPNASVDAHIMPVGVTNKGNLDVPPNYVDVGWYSYGPKPGERGSAVLDGHVDNGAELDGVFKHLRNLIQGDDIYVTMNDSRIVHYRVVTTGVYPTNAFPGNMVFHENDKAYLKIITCHGTFVPKLKTYDQRLIVTAVLVN